MILHLVSSALPLNSAQAGIVQPEDGMVFLADGVLSLLNPDNKNLATLPPSTQLYVIDDDIETRGLSRTLFSELSISIDTLPTNVPPISTPPTNAPLTTPKIITYTEFVELTLHYNQTLSW